MLSARRPASSSGSSRRCLIADRYWVFTRFTSELRSEGRIARSAKMSHVASNTSVLERIPNIVQSAEARIRSEEHTSELQSRLHLVCRLLLEKKKKKKTTTSAN